MHSLFNLSVFQFRWLAVEDIDRLETAFEEVHAAIEESAEVAGDPSLRVSEGTSVGLADDREELVEGVVGVYGECFGFELGVVDRFRSDEVAEV